MMLSVPPAVAGGLTHPALLLTRKGGDKFPAPIGRSHLRRRLNVLLELSENCLVTPHRMVSAIARRTKTGLLLILYIIIFPEGVY